MGGYCAATYKRGIDFFQIPTTLLAMVDASIGGKLGINLNNLKNQIGVFKNPKDVLIYPDFLSTLNEAEIKSGYAEIIKHVLIADQKKWNVLKNRNLKDLNWQKTIAQSIEIKNNIVNLDLFEKEERKKLNFGHTFGHAIESYYLERSTPILHGEAVLMGVLLESEMSNITPKEKLEIKNYILSNFNLPHLPKKSELIRFMQNDKKNQNGKINFSLLNGVGDCTINNLFSENEL